MGEVVRQAIDQGEPDFFVAVSHAVSEQNPNRVLRIAAWSYGSEQTDSLRAL